jgi:hypothetical protein
MYARFALVACKRPHKHREGGGKAAASFATSTPPPPSPADLRALAVDQGSPPAGAVVLKFPMVYARHSDVGLSRLATSVCTARVVGAAKPRLRLLCGPNVGGFGRTHSALRALVVDQGCPPPSCFCRAGILLGACGFRLSCLTVCVVYVAAALSPARTWDSGLCFGGWFLQPPPPFALLPHPSHPPFFTRAIPSLNSGSSNTGTPCTATACQRRYCRPGCG